MKSDTCTPNETCTLVESAKLIGDPAILLIIKILLDGEKRYKEIQEYVSVVCEATLSNRLKQLVRMGLILRIQHPEIPPRVTYTLTPKAAPFKEVIISLEKFQTIFFEK